MAPNLTSLRLALVTARASLLNCILTGQELVIPLKLTLEYSHCVVSFRTSFVRISFTRVSFSLNSYLLNGNILAARTFLGTFISYISPSGETVVIGSTSDEIIVTRDSLLNFAQLAVRCVQRAAGAQNKTAREAWVRLCRTYQPRGGIIAQPQVRVVCETDFSSLIHSRG